jgi:lipopolysaccharide assembly outer membrane protein LptD (OstA)
MQKKTIVQIALFLTLLIIIYFFLNKYFFLKKETINLTDQNLTNKVTNYQNNLIKNLEYLSTDEIGNKYLITAEYGEISSDVDSVILMTNVIAQIDLFEKDTIYLTSDFAKYNTLSLDTNFNKNVILVYTGHKITSENIDLSFEENFAWVYNNVVYKSSNNQLFADRLEIDLLTKDSKVFMYDDKKIKIIGK